MFKLRQGLLGSDDVACGLKVEGDVFDKIILSTLHRNLSSSPRQRVSTSMISFFIFAHLSREGWSERPLRCVATSGKYQQILFLTTSLEGEHHKHVQHDGPDRLYKPDGPDRPDRPDGPDRPDKPPDLHPLLVLTGTVNSVKRKL